MKEQLESNLITKYAAGLMTGEEIRVLEEWLKKNPQFSVTVAVIKQRVDALVNTAAVAVMN
jgi:anti-sigma factor RsiW